MIKKLLLYKVNTFKQTFNQTHDRKKTFFFTYTSARHDIYGPLTSVEDKNKRKRSVSECRCYEVVNPRSCSMGLYFHSSASNCSTSPAKRSIRETCWSEITHTSLTLTCLSVILDQWPWTTIWVPVTEIKCMNVKTLWYGYSIIHLLCDALKCGFPFDKTCWTGQNIWFILPCLTCFSVDATW